MVGSVSIPGAGGSPITETFDNKFNFALAQQISNAIAAASNAGNLIIHTATSTTVPPPPSNPNPGAVNELIINAGGDYTVPGSLSPDAPPWTVILDSTQAVTIHGSANTSIWGGLNTDTIIDPSVITIAESAGDAVATVTGAGDVVAGNNNNNTLTAAGNAQRLDGGTGTNVFFALGANDTVSAEGKGDTLFGGSGAATFQIDASATKEWMVGGSGALTVSDAGVSSTIFGGSGALNVTTAGSLASVIGSSGALSAVDSGTSDTIIGGTGATSATLMGSKAVVAGGLGALSVLDNGTSDTIAAGVGVASISAPTSNSFFEGGSGQFNFVGGTGNSTIFGGTGDGTVVGGTGAASLFGGNGESIEYVNTTSGGLFYSGGPGNGGIDASLSRSVNTLWAGGFGGNNSIVGGAGTDNLTAGSGSDTLTGGGGANGFYFWAVDGGPNTHNVITDFSFIDYVTLGNYGPSAPADAIASGTVANGSTTITLSDKTTITFVGVTNPSSLNGHIFST